MTPVSRRTARRTWALATLLALVLPGAARSAEADGEGEPSEPVARIQTLHDALLEAMQRADELGFEGRSERLRPVLERSFDLAFMAEKATGRHWSDLAREERDRMVELFERMTVATYAARFDDYEGESFEILGNQPAAADTVLVRTRLVRGGGGDPIHLTYRLRETPEGWKIIDVFLRGTVSELAMRRSEYSAVIRRKGFDTLVSKLEEKIRKLESGDASTAPGL